MLVFFAILNSDHLGLWDFIGINGTDAANGGFCSRDHEVSRSCRTALLQRIVRG